MFLRRWLAQTARPARSLLLAAACFVAPCLARPDGYSDGAKQQADFAGVLRFVTYLLSGASALQLLVSGAALVRMPRPRCLCYSVPYSDAAVCFGTPCCPCASIRHLSAAMILAWSVLLLCQMSVGMSRLFLYPFLGFCMLHTVTFIVVHVLMRGYRRQALLLVEAANNQAAMRLAMTAGADGTAPTAAAAAAAALPRIQTMSAELVLVLQPDYDYRGRCSADGGGGGLHRCSSSNIAGLGQRRASGFECNGGNGGDGAARGCGGGEGGKGFAWALRFTRVDSLATAAPPPKPQVAGAVVAEGRSREAVQRGSTGAGGAGAGERASHADTPVRSTAFGSAAAATAAALWRTASGTAWASTTPFTGAAATGLPPPSPPVANAGGSGIRSASVGFPMRQGSGGAGNGTTLTSCSSPSYAARVCGGSGGSTLSKRSSPVVPNHQQPLLPYPAPPPRPSSPLLPFLQGASPPRSPYHRRPDSPQQQQQPLQQLQEEGRQQPQQQPYSSAPTPPPVAAPLLRSASSSYFLCGGSPPQTPSRLGPRYEPPLLATPASPRATAGPDPNPGTDSGSAASAPLDDSDGPLSPAPGRSSTRPDDT